MIAFPDKVYQNTEPRGNVFDQRDAGGVGSNFGGHMMNGDHSSFSIGLLHRYF